MHLGDSCSGGSDIGRPAVRDKVAGQPGLAHVGRPLDLQNQTVRGDLMLNFILALQHLRAEMR